MSKLNIADLNITADASLDGTDMDGFWEGDEYHVFFMRGGKVIAGFTLGYIALHALSVLVGVGLALKNTEEQ